MSAASFRWELIRSAEWTPLSVFAQSAEHVSRGLFRLVPGIFAMTNPEGGGTEDDPGVGSVLWAESDEIALVVYDLALPTGNPGAASHPPPPTEIVGFHPLTFEQAEAYESGQTSKPLMVSARYRAVVGDGKHRTTSLRGLGREYYFRQLNPEDKDRVIAIQFSVSPVPGVHSRQRFADYVIEYLSSWREQDPELSRLLKVLRSGEMQFPSGSRFAGPGDILRSAIPEIEEFVSDAPGPKQGRRLERKLDKLRRELLKVPPV
jgi:hypothetical protein